MADGQRRSEARQQYVHPRFPGGDSWTHGRGDRLRVLNPHDPDNYYATRELVPSDMLADLKQALIVITNYHTLRLRERIEISKGGRNLLKGQTGPEPQTLETEVPDAPPSHARVDGCLRICWSSTMRRTTVTAQSQGHPTRAS